MLKIFEHNTKGNDWVVGDVHGMFSRLTDLLIERKFDTDKDRLFCTGDLVDRGPESHKALEWLAYPWFHTVRGNHENMAIYWGGGGGDSWGADREHMYLHNGGEWFIIRSREEQQAYVEAFKALPVRIQINAPDGTPDVGIIHAQAPLDWNMPDDEFTSIWERQRIANNDTKGSANINVVYLGHTPLKQKVELGNNIYIDTGACFKNGYFTLERLWSPTI